MPSWRAVCSAASAAPLRSSRNRPRRRRLGWAPAQYEYSPHWYAGDHALGHLRLVGRQTVSPGWFRSPWRQCSSSAAWLSVSSTHRRPGRTAQACHELRIATASVDPPFCGVTGAHRWPSGSGIARRWRPAPRRPPLSRLLSQPRSLHATQRSSANDSHDTWLR